MVVTLITAPHCPNCKRMRRFVYKWIQDTGAIGVCVEEVSCEDDKAIQLALEYDVEDIPALICGRSVVFGDSFTYSDIEACILKGAITGG